MSGLRTHRSMRERVSACTRAGAAAYVFSASFSLIHILESSVAATSLPRNGVVHSMNSVRLVLNAGSSSHGVYLQSQSTK